MTYQDRNKFRNKGFSYLVSGHNIVNTDIWVMDETYLNENIAILIVVGLKTTVILGVCVAFNKEKDKIAYIEAHVIKELYEQILNNGNNVPKYVHTDQKAEYRKKVILDFFQEHKINPSVSGKNENQVAESINNQIKSLIIQGLYEKYNKTGDKVFQAFKSFHPDKFKKLSLSQKKTSKAYRDFLFHSKFFNEDVDITQIIFQAIEMFNLRKSQVSDTSYDRVTLNKLNNMIIQHPIPLYGTKKTPLGNMILQMNDCSYETAARMVKNILEQNMSPEDKMTQIQNLVITREQYAPQAQERIMQALIFIASQNQQQTNKLDQLLEDNLNLTKQLDILTAEKEKRISLKKKKKKHVLKGITVKENKKHNHLHVNSTIN